MGYPEGSILWQEFLNRPFTAFRATASAISESPNFVTYSARDVGAV